VRPGLVWPVAITVHQRKQADVNVSFVAIIGIILTRKLVLKRKANELEAVYKKIRKLLDLTEIEKETDNGLRQIIKGRLCELCRELDTISSDILKAELQFALKPVRALD
jgi:hypothetical protein